MAGAAAAAAAGAAAAGAAAGGATAGGAAAWWLVLLVLLLPPLPSAFSLICVVLRVLCQMMHYFFERTRACLYIDLQLA